MTIYRVKTGYTFGKDSQYGPGDNIELSVEEASGFLDKLEMVASTSSAGDDGQETTDDSAGDDGQETTDDSAGDDGGGNLTAIEPWNGLDAKVVLALEAGGVSPAMVQTLTDAELLGVAGIGAASLAKIRSAFSG